MDLAKQYAISTEGVFVHFEDPETGDLILEDGKPVGVIIEGDGSAAYRKAVNSQHERKLRLFKLRDSLSAEDMENLQAEFLALITTGASETLTYDGDKLTSPGVAKKFYGDPACKPFRAQVERALADHRNFLIKNR